MERETCVRAGVSLLSALDDLTHVLLNGSELDFEEAAKRWDSALAGFEYNCRCYGLRDVVSPYISKAADLHEDGDLGGALIELAKARIQLEGSLKRCRLL